MLRMMSYNYGVSVDADNGKMSISAPRLQASLFAPEAPTGYRYVEGANQWQYEPDAVAFRKSCRVYEPPLEIESAIVDDRDQGIIKITFSGRFHAHADAPSSWSRTPPTWTTGDAQPAAVDALEAEDYRTVDGALRAYHVHLANGHWHPDIITGDHGQGSGVSLLTDQPFGAIYPTVFLVALVNSPYEDGNDRMDLHDTRMHVDELQKAELYLRAGCEGWMDSLVSGELICAKNPLPTNWGEGHIYDYTWESLNFQAHGGRWIGSVGEVLRPENPAGHGPLPNTKIYADVFNRTAECVNLLTRARLPIPSVVQENLTEYTGEAGVTYTASGGCDELHSASAPAATAITGNLEYGWLNVEAGEATPPGWSTRYWATPQQSPDKLVSSRYDRTTRIQPQDGWEHCIPPDLLSLVNSGYGGMMAKWRKTVTKSEITGECTADFIEEHGTWNCGPLQTGLLVAEPPASSDYQVGFEVENKAETYTQYYLMLENQTFVEVPTV
jgi:hypothetical protein